MAKQDKNKQPENKDFKYDSEITRRDLWKNFQEIAKNRDFALAQVYPLEGHKIDSRITYARGDERGEKYHLAFTLTKGKNQNGNYKEKLEIKGRDYIGSSELVRKILTGILEIEKKQE